MSFQFRLFAWLVCASTCHLFIFISSSRFFSLFCFGEPREWANCKSVYIMCATQKTKLNVKIIIKQAYHEFGNCAVNYDYNLSWLMCSALRCIVSICKAVMCVCVLIKCISIFAHGFHETSRFLKINDSHSDSDNQTTLQNRDQRTRQTADQAFANLVGRSVGRAVCAYIGIFLTIFLILRIRSQSENAIEGLVFFDIQIGSSIIYFEFVWLFIASSFLWRCVFICSHSIPLLFEFQHKLKSRIKFFFLLSLLRVSL